MQLHTRSTISRADRQISYVSVEYIFMYMIIVYIWLLLGRRYMYVHVSLNILIIQDIVILASFSQHHINMLIHCSTHAGHSPYHARILLFAPSKLYICWLFQAQCSLYRTLITTSMAHSLIGWGQTTTHMVCTGVEAGFQQRVPTLWHHTPQASHY